VACDGFESWLPLPHRRVILLFPTNDGLACAFLQWPREELQRVRADLEGSVGELFGLVPELAERMGVGRRVEPIRGTADRPNFVRKPYGPGWALIGDAGYHRDPRSAQGIKDAFRDAELLASAIDDGLSGREPLQQALACYEEQRNAAVMAEYEATYRAIEFPPMSDDVRRLRVALRENQDALDRFAGVVFDTVPRDEFFAPENLRQIVAGSGVA
jgi:flavin-dependent dehydrogenase